MKEYLPAGTTLVEGSVNSPASHFTVEDGVLTFYFTPDQYPSVTYEVFGYLPGEYRDLPTILSSAYEPGKRHLGQPDRSRFWAPARNSTDPYKPTPDEQYARGKALFDLGRWTEAAANLKPLWGGYTLRDDIAKDAARMLLTISIRDYNPRDVVVYFEVLKEKAPELVISFDDIKMIGRAYGDIGEHERAYLVWRATTDASYLEDARVGEVLRQRGKMLDGIAYLLDLWRGISLVVVDSGRLFRPFASGRQPGRPRDHRPSLASRAGDGRRDPVRLALAGDPAHAGLPGAIAQGSSGG